MTEKEINRYQVINMCLEGLLTVREAAEALSLSERQIYRLKAGVKEHGIASILHKNRGRKPSHTLTNEFREKMVRLASVHFQA